MRDLDFILLLHKRFTGTISADEDAALTDWISQSAENARLTEQYQLVWNKSTEQPKLFQPDLDMAFLELQNRIREADKPILKPVFFGTRLQRLAAVFLLLLGAKLGVSGICYSGCIYCFGDCRCTG